jgi:molybdopterin-guanine dinucleotide biosynthesis protein A
MLHKSNFIIIGATGRNTGKTEFACRLIEKYSKENLVIGLKVTAINRTEGVCPRGHKSCGVCDSLNEEFNITEEYDNLKVKDTSRMLRAGAQKVFWLKIDTSNLENGFNEILKMIPENAIVVCESNSIRKVVEPGLFLVIRNKNENNIKKSCAAVINYADKIITFNNKSWDFNPDRIIVKNYTWMIKEKATAIILAGGKSSRMNGNDKSLLPIDGEPLIQKIVNQLKDYFDEIIIGANDIEKYKFLNLKIIPDIEKDKGPLMGILSCLKESKNEINFITACDIPLMNIKLIKNMINLSEGYDIVMPMGENNNYEPLYAVYKKNITDKIEFILKENKRKIIEILKLSTVKFIDFEDNNWYQNLNFEEDYINFVKEIEYKKCYIKD